MYDRTLTILDELDLVWRNCKLSVAAGLYLMLHISFAAHLCLQVSSVGLAYTTIECSVRSSCLSSTFMLTALSRRGIAVMS